MVSHLWGFVVCIRNVKRCGVIMTSALQREDELSFTVHSHLFIIYAIGSIFMTMYTYGALNNRTVHYHSHTFISRLNSDGQRQVLFQG